MKKILALILSVLLMAGLLPASLATYADGAATEKPFYLVNWSAPTDDVKYIYTLVGSNVNEGKITDSTAADSVPVSVDDYGTDIKTIAQKLKAEFDKRPAGTRYFSFAAHRALLLAKCKDLVDVRHGVELSKNWLTALLSEYKSIGGQLDGILLDLEYNGAYTHYINANHYSKSNKNIYKQLSDNAYYKSYIRPILVERGFVFYENHDPAKYPERSELWALYPSSGAEYSKSRSIWDQFIQEHLANAMTESVYKPLIQFYPDAVVSDYKTGDSYRWYKGVSHTGGESGYNTIKAGNTSNYNFYDYATGYLFYGYGSESDRTRRTKYQKPASYNDAYFADAPYSRTNWEVNTMKRLLASTDTGKVNAWVTFYNYGYFGPGYSRTAYYSELIYHLGLTDPEPFAGYILPSDVGSRDFGQFDPYVSKYGYTLQVVDDLLTELTRVAGKSDRKAIVTPITWNEGFFYSGMYAGGRNIWRLTPDTNAVSKADFKVKDSDPTFSVNGVTITFPQGKIIEDSPVTEVGTCGYWIETPANVTPVVTSTADRYEKDPSFMDTFDYATGAFTADSVLPDTFWTVSGSASVQETDGNKWLALSGETSITNTKVPQLITAGDYYAKQQSWDVTVKLAGNYGDVTLFSAGNGDGGIKLSGGKVYYDEAGTYKEVSGVTLSDGTYTVRRVMDFRTEGAYTCTYAIYDTSGKRLGGAVDVPVAIAAIPVTEIKISVSNAESAVLMDNYKLYPIGVTANLDLYDAEFGRTLSDPAAAQTADTAYRLSWMNASAGHKVARIYNAKTGTTIQTVEMAPGMDGVVTAIVEASADSPVQIAVEVQDKSVSDSPNTDPDTPEGGNSSGDTGNDNDSGGASIVPGGNGGNSGNSGNGGNPGDPGADTSADSGKQGMSGGIIALIVILSLAALAGVGVAVYIFVIKPKQTEKPAD